MDPKPGDRGMGSPVDRAAALEKAKQVIEKRVSALDLDGVPTVTTQDPDKLVVELPPGTNNSPDVGRLAAVGSLEFYYMKDIQTAINPLGKWKMTPASGNVKRYVFTGPKGQTLDSGKPADMPKILAQVVGTPKVKPVLTGADLLPNAKSALRPSTNQPIIEIQFNDKAAQVFSDFTGKHVGEIVAVFYDGRLLTAPRINERISEGKAEISGFSSLNEATDVANSLNSGALPVHLKLLRVQKYYQGPTKP
jgi:preprotein translocase subunit SecD